MIKVTHRLRLSLHDAHYSGNLVDGARILALFGDVATELLIRFDGDEGLFRAYEKVDFLSPLYAGDFVEIEGSIISVGNTSRKIEFNCYKVIETRHDISITSADFLDQKLLCTKAIGTCVVLKEKMRKNHG